MSDIEDDMNDSLAELDEDYDLQKKKEPFSSSESDEKESV